jgi:soluble lytic murein transglycosylase
MTFYGQVAAATLNPKATLELPSQRNTSASRQAFKDQGLVQAMHALADVGSEGLLRTFALAAAENFSERDQYVFLVDFLRQLNQQALALRVAKRGIQKNLPVLDIAYPTISLPAWRGNGTVPESALILGLTRQESEFDPEAQSGAGARGLMQLMPATASLTARRHGIPYGGKGDLFTPSTNLQLGMAHVSDLLSDFAGSYILSIAAYNAGGGRSNQWIGTYGDPRNTSADALDWIERIPFSETRNYVQRVLENTQVYRAVLAGRAAPISVMNDLRRGGFTEVAANAAQFSSTATSSSPPAAAAAAAAVAAATAAAPQPQAKSVVSSSPVYDDDEVVAKPTKKKTATKPTKKKKKKKKKKKRRSD